MNVRRFPFGDLRSEVPRSFLVRHGLTVEQAAEGLRRIARTLREQPGEIGLVGGGYAYQPLDRTLTRWRTSDNGRLDTDLLTIVLEYVGTLDDNALLAACAGEDLDHHLIRGRIDPRW